MSGSDGDSTSDDTSHHNNRLEWPISISVRNTTNIVLGALLILGALGAAFGLASTPYRHYTAESETDEPFNESLDGHYRYEDLSPRGQAIFRQTLESDGPVDTSEKVPDFEYTKGGGYIYLIKYQNKLYWLHAEEDRDGFLLTGAFIVGSVGVVLFIHGSGRFH